MTAELTSRLDGVTTRHLGAPAGARAPVAQKLRPGVVSAREHLGQRLPDLCAKESRNRHWTQADLDAVQTLLDLPAAREQIALARIEGIASTSTGYAENYKRITELARKGLGL